MAKKSKPEKEAPAATGNVDLAEIERLLDFMQKHGLREFEYEREGVRIVLRKTGEQQTEAGRLVAPETNIQTGPAPTTDAASANSQAAAQKQREDDAAADALHVVKSPIVGTFYWAPSPDAEPFVTVGARVEAGQVLCIIEAMKLMNEIEADVAGEVARIFVENGHPVEYGESLFGIRPRGKK
jgi:acetyl-CoA carboxylase biotin carboxyl carrier protein